MVIQSEIQRAFKQGGMWRYNNYNLFTFSALRLCIIIIHTCTVFCYRDRKRIKNAQREEEKCANTGIESKKIRNPSEVVIDHTTERNHERNGQIAPNVQLSCSNTQSEGANSSYSSRRGLYSLTHHGVNNRTFERSFVQIEIWQRYFK